MVVSLANCAEVKRKNRILAGKTTSAGNDSSTIQNPNAVIDVLGAMGLLGGSGWLAFRFSMEPGVFALWFGAAPAAAFVVLLAPYPKFAERRLANMEA